MRLLTGAGTPREFLALALVWLFAVLESDGGLTIRIFAAIVDQFAALAVMIRPDPVG